MGAISSHERGVTISMQVQPRASRTELAGKHDDVLRVRVAAPPVDGAANAEIVQWLSKVLRVPKRDVVILSGERGRRKVILVVGASIADVTLSLDLV